jgi:hypothetical protein
MKVLHIAVAAAVTLAVSSAASADVRLTIQNGRVSLVAKDATVRQILTEWARVGQTKIVNVEKIPGGPQTIELTNVSEAEALEILLRSISGYIAAPRTAGPATASQFDSIVLMPTTAAPRPAVAPAAASMSQPVFQQPQPIPPVDDDVDDERPQQPTPMPAAAGAQRGPIFNQFPPPQVINPQTGQPMPQVGVAQPFNPGQPMQGQPQVPDQQHPTTVPTAPFGGVAVPGMVAPAPQVQQPGQIVQPTRRPGGPEDREDF